MRTWGARGPGGSTFAVSRFEWTETGDSTECLQFAMPFPVAALRTHTCHLLSPALPPLERSRTEHQPSDAVSCWPSRASPPGTRGDRTYRTQVPVLVLVVGSRPWAPGFAQSVSGPSPVSPSRCVSLVDSGPRTRDPGHTSLSNCLTRMRRGVFMFEIPNLLEYEPERSQNPSQNRRTVGVVRRDGGLQHPRRAAHCLGRRHWEGERRSGGAQ